VRRVVALLAAACVAGQSVRFARVGDDDIAVWVEVRAEVVSVEAELTIAATQREVWEVLTDFEHLPAFVANIVSSKVLAREGNTVRVAQTGKTRFGPLSFQFQSERLLTLTPCERLESRLLKGNMKRMQGDTWLEVVGGRTRLRHRSEAVPDIPVPAGVGRALIEAETREHYRDIRAEVMRRKAAARG
jgi:uncharacterized membrane protein